MSHVARLLHPTPEVGRGYRRSICCARQSFPKVNTVPTDGLKAILHFLLGGVVVSDLVVGVPVQLPGHSLGLDVRVGGNLVAGVGLELRVEQLVEAPPLHHHDRLVHPTLYTLTLHPAPYTLHPILSTFQPPPYTLHPKKPNTPPTPLPRQVYLMGRPPVSPTRLRVKGRKEPGSWCRTGTAG